MDYKRIYNNIIEYRKNNIPEGYREKHHILPHSCGGIDDETNLVSLTAREHYICHHLLTKMYDYNSSEYYKMIKAFGCMCWNASSNQNRFIPAYRYEWLKKEFSRVQSLEQKGSRNSQFGKIWIVNYNNCINRHIDKTDLIPLGFVKGRCVDFDYYFKKEYDKYHKNFKSKHKLKIKKYYRRNRKKDSRKYRKKELDFSKIELAKQWYPIYKEKGFKEFCKITDYKFSKVNLCVFFKRYYPNWEPTKERRDTQYSRSLSTSFIDDKGNKWNSITDMVRNTNLTDYRIKKNIEKGLYKVIN